MLAGFRDWTTNWLMRVLPQSSWLLACQAFSWAHWFCRALGRILAHRSSSRTMMYASNLGGHVNLFQHNDQVDRTCCMMALEPPSLFFLLRPLPSYGPRWETRYSSVVRSRWSSLRMRPFAVWCSSMGRFGLRPGDLLRVRATPCGRITMRGGFSGLLLNTLLFNSSFTPGRGWGSWDN